MRSAAIAPMVASPVGALYAYSLVPVLAVATLLFFTAAFRGKVARSLAVYCLTVAVWCAVLLLACLPRTSAAGERLVSIGAFVSAAYVHVAFDVTRQRSFVLVWLAYAVALAITLLGALWPGALYGPIALARGPLFWPAMVLAVAAAALPSWFLLAAYRDAPPERRPLLGKLLFAGLMVAAGGMGNALLLSSGQPLPFGMLLVLASLLVLGNVIRAHDSAGERRLLERSLLYAAIAAFLSAGFMFGVLSLMSSAAEPLVGPYRLGAFFLLAMAALAFEPLRVQLGEVLGRRIVPGGAGASDLVKALEVQEEKAERAERLAELGTLVSAVAHEVRNPLGVLAAHLKILERGGATGDTIAAMREQIERASRFADDLLRYGRPRPLELRMVDLAATLELSLSTARQGLGLDVPGLEVEWAHGRRELLVEADQAQLGQLFVILFDNALLALRDVEGRRALRVTTPGAEGDRIVIAVEDSGPGIPQAVLQRLFEPFVTGRKRDGPRPGTGLGLATARRIAERHGGRITAGRSEALGGARFTVELPRYQALYESEVRR